MADAGRFHHGRTDGVGTLPVRYRGARSAKAQRPVPGAPPQKLFSNNDPPISNANTSNARFTTWLPLAIARWAPR
jgi:hypothetical protein